MKIYGGIRIHRAELVLEGKKVFCTDSPLFNIVMCENPQATPLVIAQEKCSTTGIMSARLPEEKKRKCSRVFPKIQPIRLLLFAQKPLCHDIHAIHCVNDFQGSASAPMCMRRGGDAQMTTTVPTCEVGVDVPLCSLPEENHSEVLLQDINDIGCRQTVCSHPWTILQYTYLEVPTRGAFAPFRNSGHDRIGQAVTTADKL